MWYHWYDKKLINKMFKPSSKKEVDKWIYSRKLYMVNKELLE